MDIFEDIILFYEIGVFCHFSYIIAGFVIVCLLHLFAMLRVGVLFVWFK